MSKSDDGRSDDENGMESNRPGPNPKRLKLAYGEWKEALRRALESERPEEGRESDAEDEGDDATK